MYKLIAFVMSVFFLIACSNNGVVPVFVKDVIVGQSLNYVENGNETPSTFNIDFEKVSIPINNRTIIASYVKIEKSEGTIIIYHGVGESLSQWAYTQAFLAKKGYSSMVLDYTGFSNSTHMPSLKELNENALAGYEKLHEISPENEKIVVVAHSMGNWIFLEIENQLNKQPDKIILHAPPLGVKKAAVYYNRIPQFLDFVIPSGFWDPEDKIGKIKSPYILVHSKTDRMVEFSVAEKYSKVLNENGSFHVLENHAHDDIYLNPESGIWDPILFNLF